MKPWEKNDAVCFTGQVARWSFPVGCSQWRPCTRFIRLWNRSIPTSAFSSAPVLILFSLKMSTSMWLKLVNHTWCAMYWKNICLQNCGKCLDTCLTLCTWLAALFSVRLLTCISACSFRIRSEVSTAEMLYVVLYFKVHLYPKHFIYILKLV